MELFSVWWDIVNSSRPSSPNILTNAIVKGDGKVEFLNSLADWLKNWQKDARAFCFSKQTFGAIIQALWAQALLIETLLEKDGYEYVIPRKLQTDLLEKRFSQYRQMSGGRFLVSLCEVKYSERILQCKSLLKREIDFWLLDELKRDDTAFSTDFFDEISVLDTEILEASLCEDTEEVASTIAGYLAKKLKKHLNCKDCNELLVWPDDGMPFQNTFFQNLSEGGLTIPSKPLAHFVCSGFAILDLTDKIIMKYQHIKTDRKAFLILEKYLQQNPNFICQKHEPKARSIIIKTVTHVFYNNKQKRAADDERKDNLLVFKKRQLTL